jgi:hypothetical protein
VVPRRALRRLKQSGVRREEGIEELLSFTHERKIHINLKRRSGAHLSNALSCDVI